MKLQESPVHLPFRGTAKSLSNDDDNDYVENDYDYEYSNDDDNDRLTHLEAYKDTDYSLSLI